MHPSILLTLVAAVTPCWLMVNLVSYRIPRSFSAKPLSSRVDPASACSWLFLPCSGLCASPFKNSWGHIRPSLQLPRSLWKTAQPLGTSSTPPSLVWSANLVTVDSVPPFTTLMKLLNGTGAALDPWGTLLGAAAGLWQEFLQLITPWA